MLCCFIRLGQAAMKLRHHPVFQHLKYKCKCAGMGRSQMAPGMTGWSRDILSFALSRSTVWNRLKKLPADRRRPADPFLSSCCPQQLAAFLTSQQQHQGMDRHRDDLNQLSLEHRQGAVGRTSVGGLPDTTQTPLFCSQKPAYIKASTQLTFHWYWRLQHRGTEGNSLFKTVGKIAQPLPLATSSYSNVFQTLAHSTRDKWTADFKSVLISPLSEMV